MSTIAVILFAPTVMLTAARLFSGQRAAARRLALFEWAFDAVLLTALTLLFCYPMKRISVSPWYGFPLSFAYGKVAMLFSVLSGFTLGALQGRFLGRWHAEASARGLRRRELFYIFPLHFLVLALLVLTFAYLWGVRQYPVVSLEEIVFHLFMPKEGTSIAFINGVLGSVALPSAVAFFAFELLIWLPGCGGCLVLGEGKRALRITMTSPRRIPAPVALLLLGGAATLLYACLDRYIDLSLYIRSHLYTSHLIEEEYVDPAGAALTFPQEKRNLITIYLESAETTYQDAENGGIASVNYIPEMTRIARENIAFSQSDLVQGAAVTPGAGFTMAALVAQTSGVPLKLFSNQAGTWLTDFLPGATTLGDILHEHGYRNVFMAGSDFTFGGRRLYFTQHGDYEVWDLLTAYELGILPEDYVSGWGFEDRKLYAYAKDKLAELAAGDQPFHFSLLTVDTHTPGYIYECCPTGIATQYLTSVTCASRQLSEFIDWCEAQPFFENTTIVITGDHISMLSPQAMGLTTEETNIYLGSTDRFVYNAIINAAATPAKTSNRLFTTLDFFPTALASIGVQIEGEHLGLGVNLFSNEQTLAEKYGYDTLFSELTSRSTFYDRELMRTSTRDR